MLLPRILPLSILLISLLQISNGDNLSPETSVEKAVNDASFEKRQGLGDEVPDQLAVESGHQEQVDPNQIQQQQYAQQQQQVPLPVAVQAFPGNVVLPMPPGFGQAPPGVQFRGPIPQHGPPQGPHGQFSNPQPAHQIPPQQFQQGPSHPFPHQGPPQQQFPPQFNQQGHPQGHPQQGHPQKGHPQQGHPQQFRHGPQFNPQNVHHQVLQDQLRQKLPSGSEVQIQKANEVLPLGQPQSQESQQQIHVVPNLEQQQFQHQQHLHLLQQQQQQQQQTQNNLAQAQQQAHAQSSNTNSGEQTQTHPNHKNTGLVPPPPPKFQPNFERERPHQRPGFNSGESLTKNILRELFNRPKPHHDRPPHHGKPDAPNGGYFGPPQQPGQSHPKVLNRPNLLAGGRPSGGINNPKEVALSNDLTADGGEIGPIVQYGGPLAANPGGPWPEGPDGDMPKIVSLEVKCEKNVMRVFIAFDKPFYGVIFSKGHYHNVHCVHLPAGLGHTSANFDIGIDSCGTQGNTENGLYGYGVQSGSGSYFENTIVVQYDSQVQEVWDQARKLRCTWHDQYEKSVTFRPFPVDMLDVVRADFAGDNVGCWMQIQVGKGPWASEVSGLVKIGQTMTMVLAIKDDENKFDMLVRNCMAHDGNRAPIQLVDQWGCVTRPKLMSRFTKIKNFGNSASVLSYAHFQAFKFPDSMEVHFQCTIQICRHQCPEQCSQGGAAGGSGYGIGKSGLAAEASESSEKRTGERQEAAAARRKRRSPGNSTTEAEPEDDTFEYTTTFKAEINQKEDVGLNRVITVVSPDDLDFSKQQGESNEEGVPVVEASVGDIVCMSTFGFAAMLVLLIGMLLIACVVSAVIILKRPMKKNY